MDNCMNSPNKLSDNSYCTPHDTKDIHQPFDWNTKDNIITKISAFLNHINRLNQAELEALPKIEIENKNDSLHDEIDNDHLLISDNCLENTQELISIDLFKKEALSQATENAFSYGDTCMKSIEKEKERILNNKAAVDELQVRFNKIKDKMAAYKIKAEDLFQRKKEGYNIVSPEMKQDYIKLADLLDKNTVSNLFNVNKKNLARWKKSLKRKIGSGRRKMIDQSSVKR